MEVCVWKCVWKCVRVCVRSRVCMCVRASVCAFCLSANFSVYFVQLTVKGLLFVTMGGYTTPRLKPTVDRIWKPESMILIVTPKLP